MADMPSSCAVIPRAAGRRRAGHADGRRRGVYARPPRDLTIETGPAGGSYYLDAVSYQKILATHGIKLRLHQRPNSLEIVHDVGTPHSGIDVGFIAQDVGASVNSPLYSLGAD